MRPLRCSIITTRHFEHHSYHLIFISNRPLPGRRCWQGGAQAPRGDASHASTSIRSILVLKMNARVLAGSAEVVMLPGLLFLRDPSRSTGRHIIAWHSAEDISTGAGALWAPPEVTAMSGGFILYYGRLHRAGARGGQVRR